MRKMMIENFQKFTNGNEIEDSCFRYSCAFAMERGVNLDWFGNFSQIYYNNCNKILKFLKVKMDVEKIPRVSLDELNPELKKFIIEYTKLVEEKTIDQFCSRCKKITKQFSIDAQLRRADEAKSVISRCKVCEYVSKR